MLKLNPEATERLRSIAADLQRPLSAIRSVHTKEYHVRLSPAALDIVKDTGAAIESLYAQRPSFAALVRTGLLLLAKETADALQDTSGAQAERLLLVHTMAAMPDCGIKA